VRTSDTLVFKNCRDGNYTIDAMHTKLVIDECVNCKFVVNGKVISAVSDMYKCENIELHSAVAIKTLQVSCFAWVMLAGADTPISTQVDNCTNVKATFTSKARVTCCSVLDALTVCAASDNFHSIVWAGTKQLDINVRSAWRVLSCHRIVWLIERSVGSACIDRVTKQCTHDCAC
jgi:hypothetical protein